MRLVMLAGASSIHAVRWANGLAGAGLDVHLISQHQPRDPLHDAVTYHAYPLRGAAGYFLMTASVRRLLKRLRPDVVNAHYASGYATTARLAGYRPWLLSVWGSDVYDFPERSPLHRAWVRGNLEAADRVASTSHCMAERTRALAPGCAPIAITPFGVDIARFAAASETAAPPEGDAPIVIGTVKGLAAKYGIDTLIRAFARLREALADRHPAIARRLRLRLVGDGPDRAALEALAAELGVAHVITFAGRVPHDRVPSELAGMTVYAALSRLDSESFGVAVIEAAAAYRPVVVSDAGGLPEVVRHGHSGFVVPREDPAAAAAALEQLVTDPERRARMGRNGAADAAAHYSWDTCVAGMIDVLEATRDARRG